jgi:putative glycosyltransferase
MKLSIVTTLYRSARHLQEFHARITAAAKQITDDYEIILVNDGSPDDSQAVAQSLCDSDPKVGVVELSRNFGHHKAMMTGLAQARGDLVFLIDCDLEEPPEALEQFFKTMASTTADVVYGVQAKRKGGWFERISGALAYKVFDILSTDSIPRNVITCRLMTRDYVRSLLRHREREVCIAGLWVITGYKQVPLIVEKKSLSPTTYSLRQKMAMLIRHLAAFSNKPLIYIFYLGCLIMALSVATGIFLIVRRILYGMLEGWASVMVSIWFLGGLSIFCIGIIGIYLAKTFSEVKRRPYTIIRERYGLLARVGRPRRRRRTVHPLRNGISHDTHATRPGSPAQLMQENGDILQSEKVTP